jgi:GNAT superfamily N-acetyltransferase
MNELTPISRAVALSEVPDAPDTLEFRSMALDARTEVYRSGSGLLLLHDAAGGMLGAVGEVKPAHGRQLFEPRRLTCELLADRRAYEVLSQEYSFERAKILRLVCDWRSPGNYIKGLVIRLLEPSDALAHLPTELANEIESQRFEGEIIAGFIGNKAVSFAYAGSTTETLADVSIDTLAEYRRTGIGRAVVSALIDRIVAGGKAPVWGAVVDNVASLALAASIGFTRPAGELFVHEA